MRHHYLNVYNTYLVAQVAPVRGDQYTTYKEYYNNQLSFRSLWYHIMYIIMYTK